MPIMKPALDHIFIDPHVKGTSLVRRIFKKSRVPAIIITDKKNFLRKPGRYPRSEPAKPVATGFKASPQTMPGYRGRLSLLPVSNYQYANQLPLDCSTSYSIFSIPDAHGLRKRKQCSQGNRRLDRLRTQTAFQNGDGRADRQPRAGSLTRINETLVKHALKRKYILEMKTKTILSLICKISNGTSCFLVTQLIGLSGRGTQSGSARSTFWGRETARKRLSSGLSFDPFCSSRVGKNTAGSFTNSQRNRKK